MLAGSDCGRVVARGARCPIVVVHLEQQHVPIARVAERALQLLASAPLTRRLQLANQRAQVLVSRRRWRLAVFEQSSGSFAG